MKQLHDNDSVVRQAAFEILLVRFAFLFSFFMLSPLISLPFPDISIHLFLQEASEDEVVMNNLSVESIATLHVDFSGYMLFSRLLSLPSHFDKLNKKNAINFFLDSWKEV